MSLAGAVPSIWLLYETRVCEEELRGFSEDKLKTIPSFAKFLAEDAVLTCILSAIAC